MFIEKKFPEAEILIPPNVTRTDEDLPNMSSKKKRVLNPEEADYQEPVNLSSLLHFYLTISSDHWKSVALLLSGGRLKRSINP